MPFDATSVTNTAIANLPAIVALIKALHSQAQPDAPALTDEQVVSALNDAIAASVTKDERWLAAHSGGPDIGSDVPGGGAV